MGYDLYNKKENYFRWRIGHWQKLLRLASDYGWIPEGLRPFECTIELFKDDFDVDELDYYTNSYQTVTASDAKNIADALKNALNDLPDIQIDDTFSDNQICIDSMVDLNEVINNLLSTDVDLLAFFSGKVSKQKLRAFIKYCREGEFRIC